MLSIISEKLEVSKLFVPLVEELNRHFEPKPTIQQPPIDSWGFPANAKLIIFLIPQDTKFTIEQIALYIQDNLEKQFFVVIWSDKCELFRKLLDLRLDCLLPLPIDDQSFFRRITESLSEFDGFNIDDFNQELVRHGMNDQFVGSSNVLLNLLSTVKHLSQAKSAVLITGSSGTGKELFARAIHYLGPRSSYPFMPVNCGAIPDSLFENELFGHEKGAYTDASKNQKGLLQQANGGTIFLDEINSLNYAVQVKLLRFLEDGLIKPLGSSDVGISDVRVICASNSNIGEKVKTGEFREDLFFRINVLRLDIPSLKERENDIIVLARHYLRKYSESNRRGPMYFSDDAIKAIKTYAFPGNVREISNLMERTVVMAHSNIIHARDLQLPCAVGNVESIIEQGYQEAKNRAIEEFEKQYLLQILEENEWNITQVARRALTDRRSIQRMLRKYNIKGPGLKNDN
jgi:DNA-binding NtrC family response regulator